MFSDVSSTKMTFGFKVNTNSPKWHRSTMKILKKIKGANFTINVEEGLAYVSGQGNPNKLLKLMGTSTGKDAEVAWVRTGRDVEPNYNNYNTNYYNHGQGLPCNYWQVEYNYPSNYPYHVAAPSNYYPSYSSAAPYHHNYGGSYLPYY